MNLWNIKTMRVKVERLIEASPAEIFDAWLDPNCQGSPWNGVAKAILQPVVDGLFYRMHLSGEGDYELAHYGRFLVVERPTTIKYTWVSQHTRGLESVVTVSLQARDEATWVIIEHENLPDDEQGRMHEGGWNEYLGQMSKALSPGSKR
jgi:uncharacterized protein YndB with AHSA1/START domain